ncbi:hypothetical protein [Pseudomonas sp.]|uniref:DUF6124 family protein n=1 Tax=Pseudomonas sp. TaxID=306 RepID=UPI002606C202|nr:hypothetical protein [Pseudomonas sp.]
MNPRSKLFTVLPASIIDIAAHLAFEVDGAQRNVALGICRMLEGVQLLAGKVLDEAHPGT